MSIKKMSDMTPEERYILQQACRHQMRVKLLADSLTDYAGGMGAKYSNPQCFLIIEIKQLNIINYGH